MNLIINGISGRMGKYVLEAAKERKVFDNIVGVDLRNAGSELGIKVFDSIDAIPNGNAFDCIIDFSVKESVYHILPYAIKNSIPVVIATTGFDEKDIEYINKASESIPILKSGNMSLGINAMLSIVEKMARIFGDKADIEIIEQHHNKKIDAPSGTALMLASAAQEGRGLDCKMANGREGITGQRSQNEIGMHAVRGGSIVGKHEVVFALDKEVVSLKHEAEDRSIFAKGSIDAALFIRKQKAGLYSMKDMLS